MNVLVENKKREPNQFVNHKDINYQKHTASCE